jgi:hypothetical protein
LGRFLDEAAVKLARLNGDPVLAAKFAGMPIMLVVYNGGYSAAEHRTGAYPRRAQYRMAPR